ncbi:MerR family transcriptional regulator [Microtetraspora malaysiensis]|uniref:MerR family transcriptional regulator n=1 Tax=Microtetraspora malaysiensis TaxID=161358 RepID=UPI003D8DA04C
MDETLLDIGEVAERTGLAASALRFYERKGLISSTGRNGLRRAYRPEVLERLGLIMCARSAGFGIAEIGSFLGAGPGDQEVREKMAVKAGELNQRIAQLTRLRDALDHAATCDHEPLTECPDFKRAVWNARTESTVSSH